MEIAYKQLTTVEVRDVWLYFDDGFGFYWVVNSSSDFELYWTGNGWSEDRDDVRYYSTLLLAMSDFCRHFNGLHIRTTCDADSGIINMTEGTQVE